MQRTYCVRWSYARRLGLADKRFSGGEYFYQATDKADAVRQLLDRLAKEEWTQPWDAELIEASVSPVLAELATSDDFSHELAGSQTVEDRMRVIALWLKTVDISELNRSSLLYILTNIRSAANQR